MLVNTVNNKAYIGQTSGTIETRLKGHRCSMRAYEKHLKDPTLAYKGTCTYLYKAMLKHGVGAFEMFQILECPNDMLDAHEIELIKSFNTLAPNGYNLASGGGHFQHHELTKQELSEQVRKIMLADIDKFRSSEHTKGMPAYVAYCSTPDREAYYVNNHPLHIGKKYFTKANYETLEAAKEACAEYVRKLGADGVVVQPVTALGFVEKGLRATQYGYRVRKDIKGVHYEKSFNNKYQTKEQNYEEAIAYIKSLQE